MFPKAELLFQRCAPYIYLSAKPSFSPPWKNPKKKRLTQNCIFFCECACLNFFIYFFWGMNERRVNQQFGCGYCQRWRAYCSGHQLSAFLETSVERSATADHCPSLSAKAVVSHLRGSSFHRTQELPLQSHQGPEARTRETKCKDLKQWESCSISPYIEAKMLRWYWINECTELLIYHDEIIYQ